MGGKMQDELSLKQKIINGLLAERKRLKRRLLMPISGYSEADRTIDEMKYQEIGRKIQEFKFS